MAELACWACAHGLGTAAPPVQQPLADGYHETDLLGSCWECGVFACSGHAERDRGSGKWVCYQSVARALSVSANLDRDESFPKLLIFKSEGEFAARFPILSAATENTRASLPVEGVVLGHMASRDRDVTDLEVNLVTKGLSVIELLSPEPTAELQRGDASTQSFDATAGVERLDALMRTMRSDG